MSEQRLIDAEGLAKKVNEEICRCDCVISTMFARRFKKLIDEQPTIEAEPVKHGEWVIAKDKDGFAMWDACSSCGHGLHYVCEGKRFPYCPNCGAKMDKE